MILCYYLNRYLYDDKIKVEIWLNKLFYKKIEPIVAFMCVYVCNNCLNLPIIYIFSYAKKYPHSTIICFPNKTSTWTFTVIFAYEKTVSYYQHIPYIECISNSLLMDTHLVGHGYQHLANCK